ncbi:hypothetical protein [Deinococcus pimensis]|uniref:hypothetical protein n=1 Tax=Deinococcus pimensis TaxID=309888 RepID=UPI0004B6024A|nr:hypothetical protein [Deinococcus pimensis]
MPEDHDRPQRTPEPPDQEALSHRHGDAEGPFGADMTNLRGGTRSPDQQDDHTQHGQASGGASPYGTGTSETTGGSLDPTDPRTNARGQSRTGNEDAEP